MESSCSNGSSILKPTENKKTGEESFSDSSSTNVKVKRKRTTISRAHIHEFKVYDDKLREFDFNRQEVDILLKSIASWIDGKMPCLKGVVSCAFTHSAFTNVECLAMGEYMQRCPFRPTFSQLECVPIAMLLKAHASVILHPAEIFFILNHLHCSLDDFCMTLISTKEEVKFDYRTGSLEPKPDDSATSQMVVQGIRKIYGVVFDKFELLRFIYRPTYEKYFESHIYNTYDVAS